MVGKTTFGERVRAERENRGWSQAHLAGLLGMDISTVSKIESGASRRPRNFIQIANTLGIPVSEATDLIRAERGELDPPSPRMTRMRVRGDSAPMGPLKHMPISQVDPVQVARELPILGYSAGGESGRFILNGEIVGTVGCPPELARVSNAYCVYISGPSMIPRFYPGEIAYVDPNRPPRGDDFVVVQIGEPGSGEPPEGFVKQFVGWTDETLTLHQFNPDQNLVFPSARVISVHNVVLSGRP